MALLPAVASEFTEETRHASPANFLIKIESFSLLSHYGIDKYESRAFDAGGYKWKLIINFEGDDVSVYFSIAESASLPVGWEVNAIFAFFVQNQLVDTYHCFRGMTKRFNAVNPKWGLSKLIPKKSLIDPSQGYVVDDSCVLGAEVLVIKTQRISECLSLIKETTSYVRDWKLSDFSNLGEVWNSEKFVVGKHNWKVTLFPKGNGSQAEDRFVSIYVKCVGADNFAPLQKVKAEVTLNIKSMLNRAHHFESFSHWFTSSNDDWGFAEFIPIADMSSKGFLVDDCCFLEVTISVQALAFDAPQI